MKELISYIPYIIIGIITLVDLIMALINGKKKGFLEAMKIVEEQIEKFMAEAEKARGLSGEEKKNYVVRKTQEFMEEQSIKIPLEEIIHVIERVIKISKAINIK